MRAKQESRDTVIAKAIEALNELTTHYQDISAPITIKLAVPWVEDDGYAKGLQQDDKIYSKGLLGVIDFIAPSNTHLLDHPFINALKTTNLRMFSHSHSKPEGETSFRCCFVLYELSLIEQLPEKCQECIDETLNQNQGLRL
jgi:hypothetical protein